ncbi:MAG: UdgX family uracil-DNA binding protein [Candidatus Saccharibacteria bacterium]|nr:UdgX family uracil-DNA binding protein [Pseudorhodobacter sp.]
MIYRAGLSENAGFAEWRGAARAAICHHISPADIDWTGNDGLFDANPLPQNGAHHMTVTPAFMELAETVGWHAAPDRFADLYAALWRLQQGEGDPLSHSDPLGRKLHLMAKAVRRDIHKMHAFVRFHELPGETGRRSFAAWFEPDHNTLEPGTKFFVNRFADMDWLIATPRQTAQFVAGDLTFAKGGPRPDLPDDASEVLWATYFTNIFNPARIKINAMQTEMPRKYWKNLPETRLIPGMLADAEARVERMRAAGASVPRAGAEAVSTRYRAAMPAPGKTDDTLDEARQSALHCRRCHLCEAATQTVWGEGPPDARLMIVGEQPGDREDLEGRPFVGPAGTLLRQTMERAGIKPESTYLTNAVKHFKFEPRGKRRLHQNPDRNEIEICRWWVETETRLIQPKLILALGASAALSLTGRNGALKDRRGKLEDSLFGIPVMVSWHPSYILRIPDAAVKAEVAVALYDDLQLAAQFAASA